MLSKIYIILFEKSGKSFEQHMSLINDFSFLLNFDTPGPCRAVLVFMIG